MGWMWHIKGIMIAPDIQPDEAWLVGNGGDNVMVSLPLLLVLFGPRAVSSLGICQVSGNDHNCWSYMSAQIRACRVKIKWKIWKFCVNCAVGRNISISRLSGIDLPSSMEIWITFLTAATEPSCQQSSTWRYEDLWSEQTNWCSPRCSQPSPIKKMKSSFYFL